MRHSQNYRWVSQPRQFPGQKLDRFTYCDQPQAIVARQASQNLVQVALNKIGEILKTLNVIKRHHSWE